MVRLAVVVLLASVAAIMPSVLHADIAGSASVIDGDTIEVHGQRIRLYGVDAPESAQLCQAEGKSWRCGQQASLALFGKIGGRSVSCRRKDVDRYRRVVAVCFAGSEDLNAWTVAEGWALAYRRYSTDYVGQEQAASAARKGIWRGSFVPPWVWRTADRRPAPNDASSGQCRIKGNISSRGERIYHVPGGEFYDRTRIDTAKGERWFCTEAGARAAGWRRSLR
jgi:endonuclease YncB( thermonuclease family)